MRISLRISAATLTLTALLLPVAPGAHAQTKAAPASPAPAATAPASTAPSEDDLAATREHLLSLLRMSPTLTEVLETDPTLLADQDYVSRTNPQLARFLTEHPEVTRNPDFYLFADIPQSNGRRVDRLYRRGERSEPISDQELHRREMNDLAQVFIFICVVGSLLWLIRIFLENRRWSRIVRQQSEIHGKLIDRLANNQELFQYMESESGRRFLEAGPVPIALEREQRLPGGLSRVLGPLQFGIVLTLLGAGLLILQTQMPSIADALLVFGTVALMPGLGFIISAIITWRISARLGLMPQTSATAAELSARQ